METRKMRMSKRHRKESASEEWRLRSLRRIVALFAALVVSLMLTAAASANVSFTKAYGWGVLDGASQFETCTSTCQYGMAGAGAGQLNFYGGAGVATDSSGDVYVVAGSNDRVDEFSAAGAFIKAYGWGVADGASQFETCTSSCQAGISGGGAGQFDQPEGVATDSSGDVYVVDSGNERVDEFSAAGAFIEAYGWGVADGLYQFETCTSTCQSGRAGGGAGQFEEPGGIATDSSGDVYVGDNYNERIDEFSAAGAFIKAFGSTGYGAGQLEDPEGVATDSSGDVYVADSFNNRIDEFSAAGAFIEAYGWGVADGMGKFETCTSTCQQGGQGGGAGQLNSPTGVATDSSGDVYVTDGANERVDEFSAAGAFIEAYGWGVADGMGKFETCTSTCQSGIFGAGAGELSTPWGVAVDGSGDIYVADYDNERVDEFGAVGAVSPAPPVSPVSPEAPVGAAPPVSPALPEEVLTSLGAPQTPSVDIAKAPHAVEEVVLVCTRQPLVLSDVLVDGSRVLLAGSADRSLHGRTVKIVFAGHHVVATARVGSNGLFSTTAPLPAADIRETNLARYQAVYGRMRSLDLKLTRRLQLQPPRVSGRTVTLVGEVVPPLTGPIATIAVQQELKCGRNRVVGYAEPGTSGRFRITLTVPRSARAGIYRLTSTVLGAAGSTTGFATYSLPLPAVL
jgi:NHL repeat